MDVVFVAKFTKNNQTDFHVYRTGDEIIIGRDTRFSVISFWAGDWSKLNVMSKKTALEMTSFLTGNAFEKVADIVERDKANKN